MVAIIFRVISSFSQSNSGKLANIISDSKKTADSNTSTATQPKLNADSFKGKEASREISNHIDAMALPSNESIVDEIRNIVTDKKAELQTIERQVEELERASTIDKAKFLKFALNYVDGLSTRFFELPREK